MTSVSILVAIGVDGDGYREILGACEGASESGECWKSFLVSLKERGLKGVRLITSDKHQDFLEFAAEVFPDGDSALMLVCARLRYVASKDLETKRYLNMKHLHDLENQREMDKEKENLKTEKKGKSRLHLRLEQTILRKNPCITKKGVGKADATSQRSNAKIRVHRRYSIVTMRIKQLTIF